MNLVTKYYLITALHNAYFPLAIWTLYFVDRWQFSYTQVMSIFVASFMTATLLDLFGGMYADAVGRKKSAVIGYGLEIVGIVSFVATGNFIVLLGCALLMGIGSAMISGSLDALIADELGAESIAYKQANARVQMYLFLARVGASIVGGLLYTQNESYPYIVYAVVVFGALCVTSSLQDSHVVEKLKTNKVLLKELSSVLSANTVMQRICVGLFLGTFAGDLIWVYYQPFYTSVGWSAFTLGLLFAGISLLSAGGSWLVSKFHDTFLTPQEIFKLCALATGINGVLFLSGNLLLSLAGLILMAVTSGMSEPATREYFSSVSTPRNRATMLSLGSSASSIGLFIGFMVGGILLDAGLQTIMLTCVVVASGLYFIILKTIKIE